MLPCGNLFFIKKSHIWLESKLVSFPQYNPNPEDLGSWLLSQNEIILDWDGTHTEAATCSHVHKGLSGCAFFEFIWYLPYYFSLPSRKFHLVFNWYSFFNKGYRTANWFFSIRLISKLLVINLEFPLYATRSNQGIVNFLNNMVWNWWMVKPLMTWIHFLRNIREI